MSLRERLDADLRTAMKSRQPIRVETLRAIRGAVRNREIEVGSALEEEGILRVIRTLVKQREEAATQYRAGGRPELAEKEEAERAVLEGYLPAAPGPEDVERAVREVIAETGACGPKDLGRVMRPALERLGPAADGKLVSETARRLLSGG